MAAHLAAMMATPETVNDSNWYPDSSATNHCTPHFNNLVSSDAYHGQEQLHMGDGSCYCPEYWSVYFSFSI